MKWSASAYRVLSTHRDIPDAGLLYEVRFVISAAGGDPDVTGQDRIQHIIAIGVVRWLRWPKVAGQTRPDALWGAPEWCWKVA